jgi:hypothetical protein
MPKPKSTKPKMPLGERMRHRANDRGLRMEDLAVGVSELLGEDTVTATAFVGWLKQPERVRPDRIFAIERLLEVEPGTYSRELGYLPLTAGAWQRPSLEAFLATEPTLDSQARRLLVTFIRALHETDLGGSVGSSLDIDVLGLMPVDTPPTLPSGKRTAAPLTQRHA